MEKYLIALDMDGTLLNKNHVISETTSTYLKNLAKQGHIIVIASGRPVRGIMNFYKELELDTPIICYNGAYIYPGKLSDFPEYKFNFPRETILKILKEIGDENIENIILETNEDIYLLHNDDSLDIFFSKVNMCVHLGRIENILDEDPMTTLIKVKDISKSDELSKIVEQYDGLKLRFWSGRWTEISEIYFEKINKGDALRKIANYYNIPTERIISFGDANNDIELIQVGKYGFAMKNGEVELKQYASKITEFTNDEDGVIKEIQKIIK